MTELQWPLAAPVALGRRLAAVQSERDAAMAAVDRLTHEYDEGPYGGCRTCRIAADNPVHRTRRAILSTLAGESA